MPSPSGKDPPVDFLVPVLHHLDSGRLHPAGLAETVGRAAEMCKAELQAPVVMQSTNLQVIGRSPAWNGSRSVA